MTKRQNKFGWGWVVSSVEWHQLVFECSSVVSQLLSQDPVVSDIFGPRRPGPQVAVLSPGARKNTVTNVFVFSWEFVIPLAWLECVLLFFPCETSINLVDCYQFQLGFHSVFRLKLLPFRTFCWPHEGNTINLFVNITWQTSAVHSVDSSEQNHQ